MAGGNLTRTLKILIAGDAGEAVKAFAEVEEHAEKSSGKLGKFNDSMGKLSVGILAMAGAAGAGLLAIGESFESAERTIRVGTGATGEALERLNDSMKKVLRETPSSIKDVSTAIADLNTRLDVTGPVLEELAVKFLNVSRLTGTSLTGNIEASSQAFKAFGLNAEESSASLDFMWKVSQSTGVAFDKLSGKLQSSALTAIQLGFSVKDTTALIGQLEKGGGDADMAFAALKRSLSTMAKAGEDPRRAFVRLVDEIKNTADSSKAAEKAIDLFGSRAGPSLATLIKSGSFSIDSLVKSLDGSSESINGASEDTLTFKDRLNELKNKLMVDLEPAAMKMIDWLDVLGEKFEALVGWAEDNKTTVKALAVTFGVLAGAVVAYTTALRVYAGIQAAIKVATAAWTVVQWLLNVALTANPIGLIVIAVGALVAAIVLVATKTTWFQTAWHAVWDALKIAAEAVGNWFNDTLWHGILEPVFLWIYDKQVTVFGFFQGLPDRIGGWLSGIGDIIMGAFRGALNWVNDQFNKLIRGVNIGIRGINVINPFGNIPEIPEIPRLAAGGRLRAGQAAIVGEQGWELFVPDQSGTVAPHGVASAALASGGGMIVVVNVAGSVTAERDLAKSIAVAIRDQITRVDRRNGRAVTA